MYEVVALAKNHDRAGFDCGDDELNRYLLQYANQHAKKGISQTHVLIDDGNPNEVLGFYCMGAYALDNGGRVLAGYPNEIPACLIGRFAIDKTMQGKSLANHLFAHAFAHITKTAKIMGIGYVVVDLKRDELAPFYQKMGFQRLSGLRMVLSTKVLF